MEGEAVRGYSEAEAFTTNELELWRRATDLVAQLPAEFEGEPVRCHELARFVGDRFGLEYQDGSFGFVEHTWLWTKPRKGREALWALPNILDVYVPGELPQVQLIHTSTALPMPYRFGPPRTDIRERVIVGLLSKRRP